MPTRHSQRRLPKTMLIPPCGLNCHVCRAHVRKHNPCPGCRADDATKPITRCRCTIKLCPSLSASSKPFCSYCTEFPCHVVQHLDKRYRRRYSVSPVANLKQIKTSGVRTFVANEQERWECPACGGLLCMHDAPCPTCGRLWRKS
jgi:hypothetical protein